MEGQAERQESILALMIDKSLLREPCGDCRVLPKPQIRIGKEEAVLPVFQPRALIVGSSCRQKRPAALREWAEISGQCHPDGRKARKKRGQIRRWRNLFWNHGRQLGPMPHDFIKKCGGFRMESRVGGKGKSSGLGIP